MGSVFEPVDGSGFSIKFEPIKITHLLLLRGVRNPLSDELAVLADRLLPAIEGGQSFGNRSSEKRISLVRVELPENSLLDFHANDLA